MSRASRHYDIVVIDGPELQQVRKTQRRLTQEDLAKQVGITRGYLSMIETNSQARVGRNTVENLASALDVTIATLQGRNRPFLPSITASMLPLNEETLGAYVDDRIAKENLSSSELEIVEMAINNYVDALLTFVSLLRNQQEPEDRND